VVKFLKTDVHPFCLMEGTRRLEIDHPVKVIKQNFLDENMEILQANLLSFDKTQLIVDVLHLSEEKQTTISVRPRVNSKSTCGMGCTLSSAIASQLTKGSTRILVCSFHDSRDLNFDILVE